MKLNHTAIAGTLESSDVQVTIGPGENGVQLSLQSTVIREFGRQIEQTIRRTLENTVSPTARSQ